MATEHFAQRADLRCPGFGFVSMCLFKRTTQPQADRNDKNTRDKRDSLTPGLDLVLGE
jgi:hypothetical protein